MSQYGGYGGQAEVHPRYGYPAEPSEVLARVPDMQGETPPLEHIPSGHSRTRRQSPLSPRLIGAVSTMVLVAGVIGFLVGRAGDSASRDPQEAWYPEPPAADAPEAPAWRGNNVAAAPPLPPGIAGPTAGRYESAPTADPLAGVEGATRGGLVALGPPPHAAPQPSASPPGGAMAPSWNPGTWQGNPAPAGSPPATGIAGTPYPGTPYPPNPGAAPLYPPQPTNPPPAIYGPGEGDADRFTNPYAEAVAAGQIGTPAVADYTTAPSPYAQANQSMSLDAAASGSQGCGPSGGTGGYSTMPSDPRLAARPDYGVAPPPSPTGSGSYPPSSGYPRAGAALPSVDERGQPYAPGVPYGGNVYPPAGTGVSASPSVGGAGTNVYPPTYSTAPGYSVEPGAARFDGTIAPPNVRMTP